MKEGHVSHLSNRQPSNEIAHHNAPTGLRFARSFSALNRSQAAPLRERIRPVTSEEFRTLLTVLEKDSSAFDLKDIATIIYHTAIRPGELCDLLWTELDFSKRCMIVTSKKSGHRRRVPFGDKVSHLLNARRERERHSEFLFGRVPDRVLRRACEQLRVLSGHIRTEAITFRSLRHTFMSRWCNAGGSAAQLACITGITSMVVLGRSEASFDYLYAAAARFQAQLEEESD